MGSNLKNELKWNDVTHTFCRERYLMMIAKGRHEVFKEMKSKGMNTKTAESEADLHLQRMKEVCDEQHKGKHTSSLNMP